MILRRGRPGGRMSGVSAVALATLGMTVWGPAVPRVEARGKVPAHPPVETTAPSSPEAVEPAAVPAERVAVVWTPVAGEDLLTAAESLVARPGLRVTIVFPPDAFSDEEKSLRAWQMFLDMVARRQVEVVPAVAGDPPLALLLDSDLARVSSPTVAALPPRFSWPDDVVGHLALTLSDYRRRWRLDPAGLVLPGGCLAGPELPYIERMKFRWLLMLDGAGTAGYFGGLPIGIVRPELFPAKPGPARAAWVAARRAGGVPSASDPLAAGLARAPIRIASFEDLKSFEQAVSSPSAPAWGLLSEVMASAGSFPVWPGLDAEPPDFSPWIGEPEENVAWRLLGVTRQAVEDYKNSGLANLKNLDLALREIYHAESGRTFDSFGNDNYTVRGAEVEMEFIATLAQVHRLMGRPVPSNLLQSFSVATSAATDREAADTVFERDGAVLRWIDSRNDDRGPGDYFYPVGAEYAPGSWDLTTFEIRPQEKTVTFRFEFAALGNPWRAPGGFCFPLVDVYIDINGIPGAGAESLLPGRPGLVESRNAWEYAVSVNGWGGRVYQYAPGSPPRRVARVPVKATAGGFGFRIDLPRDLLRGDSDRWTFGVVVMGQTPPAPTDAARPGDEPDDRPLRVLPEPSPANFGGAWSDTSLAKSSREAPPFIDLLVPPRERQARVLGVYKQGRDVVIPFVRVE